MKSKKICIISFMLAMTTAAAGINASDWSLFQLIDAANRGRSAAGELEKFNPGTDLQYLPPLEGKSLFESINDLSICRRKDVRAHIFQYLTMGRAYLKNGIIRSNRYHKIVEDIFQGEKDMPPDLSLLPMLESGFNPYAVSRSRAVGMWQFLKGTSRSLGLKSDDWIDERRHVKKSTIAAISHLRNLYKTFNSWEIALAAYNCGAGRMKWALKKSGAKNLDELIKSRRLKKETNEFVPRFAALCVLYKNQELFDIDTAPGGTPALETGDFVLDCPADIRTISKYTGVPVETIRNCNPELNKNITPPYHKNYTIRIPVDAGEAFMNNKSKFSEVYFRRLEKHVVKEGECLSVIAARYNAVIKNILVINNIDNPNRIKPGLHLYIPI